MTRALLKCSVAVNELLSKKDRAAKKLKIIVVSRIYSDALLTKTK